MLMPTFKDSTLSFTSNLWLPSPYSLLISALLLILAYSFIFTRNWNTNLMLLTILTTFIRRLVNIPGLITLQCDHNNCQMGHFSPKIGNWQRGLGMAQVSSMATNVCNDFSIPSSEPLSSLLLFSSDLIFVFNSDLLPEGHDVTRMMGSA